MALGKALLQHQHSGVLPSFTHPGHVASEKPETPLALSDPLNTLSMPESWVRAAMLIRMNSLVRGHSGVRWVLLERMAAILEKDITPLVPLRGSISASGGECYGIQPWTGSYRNADLSPLSYVAGTIFGNEQIRVFHGKRCAEGPRQITSSRAALEAAGIEPLRLAPKEHLGLLNGTAFSAAVASLALNDAVHMGMLAQVLTAMGTEALVGMQGGWRVVAKTRADVLQDLIIRLSMRWRDLIPARWRRPSIFGICSRAASWRLLVKRRRLRLLKMTASFARTGTLCGLRPSLSARS